MSKVLEFVTAHWILVSLFVIAFIWVIFEEGRHQGVGGVRQSPQGVTSLINNENAVVIDLRDVKAFKDGHITNSVNIPMATIDQKMSKIEAYKDRPMILVCAMGQQSTRVMNKLRKQGFEKVYILGGGVGAWKKDNLPLKKS